MNMPRFFVDRPIFAAVTSIFITLLGVLALLRLPVAQYPEVAPPTVVVTAVYPGADARTLAETVSTPLEQEINGVEDMLYLSSSSTSDGRVQITVTFELGTDLDRAQVLVQNRVNATLQRLPEEVRRLGVNALKRSPDLTLAAQFYSPDRSRDTVYLANFVNLQIRERVARLPGVSEASTLGGLDFSMRLWLDPVRMGARGVTAGDVVRAVREQNVQIAAGALGQQPAPAGEAFQYTLVAPGRLRAPEEFERIVLRVDEEGRAVRLADVARVEIGAQEYATRTYMNGYEAVSLRVFQLPGTNAIDTADRVYALLASLREEFPPGVDFRINYDTTQFVRSSIRAVLITLAEAVLLVVLVVVMFLQTWRASVIPLLAVPVSLIGTLAVMSALGFTLNNLSLFGLVLAIGIVVDDAIVVVENVERYLAQGLAPREATLRAMEEVTRPIIAVSLVLAAVFVPTAFISGITGQFYKQFALTIAVSTGISAFNSLSLSPALCALLLRPHTPEAERRGVVNFLFGWFFRGFNRAFAALAGAYAAVVRRICRFAAVALLVYFALTGLGAKLFQVVPGGFIPNQDMGYLITVVQLPDAASFERTDAVVRRMDEIARSIPGVAHTFAISGYTSVLQANQSNVGAAFLVLDKFRNRRDPALRGEALLATIRARFSEIQEGRVLVLPPPPLRGLGNAGGFKVQVQDLRNAGLEALQDATRRLVEALQREPGFTSVLTGFRANTPQFRVDIDRERALVDGVPLTEISQALQVFLGSVYINDFNLLGRTWQVKAQAEPAERATPEALERYPVRAHHGGLVPLASFVRLIPSAGIDRIQRYNLYPSADVSGNILPGVSSGQMIERVERIAQEVLPAGFGIEWTDLAFQQKRAGNTLLFILPLCVIFVFLFLSAQYESWGLPVAILLIVPLCVLSALVGVWLAGMDNNLFTQIGFVVLIGLAAKNAILIVEFAKQREDAGQDRFAAAEEACRLRLRPILMTSMAFILGVVPLAFASGAGAEMRRALGVTVFSGMIGVTVFGLLFTPVFYVVIRRFSRRRAPREEASHG
jgi:multidrug efflux pump